MRGSDHIVYVHTPREGASPPPDKKGGDFVIVNDEWVCLVLMRFGYNVCECECVCECVFAVLVMLLFHR